MPPRLRTLVKLALPVLALTWLTSGPARAQSCHAPAVELVHDEPLRVTAGALYASYGRGEDEAGDYQGVYAGVAYRQPWYGLEVLLPAYRLSRDAGTELGLGDLVVTARGTLLRTAEDVLRLGVELPVMVPTGSEARELGMGHVMLMPALWLELDLEPLVLRAEVGYGRMLGGEAEMAHGHHTSGPPRSPIVNPMNRSELEHALTLVLGLQRQLSVHARWLGAVPIADAHGVVRQTLAAGATASLDSFALSLELQRPIAGDAFDVKVVLQLAARF